MSDVSIFNLSAGTTLAGADVLPFVDVSDSSQSPQGSTLKITVTNFFGTVPAPIIVTSTSTQLQLKYDGSNHVTVAVSAAGAVTLNATGTSAGFTFSDPVTLASGVAGNLSVVLGAIAADAQFLNGSATWNNAGVTFTGIFTDVTDTASAAGSYLMDLRVGNVQKFYVKKDGTALFAAGISATGYKTGSGTQTVANGATTTIFAATAQGTYYVTCTVAGSTTIFASGIFMNNGAALTGGGPYNSVTTPGAALTNSGTNIQISNTDASSRDFDWRYIRVN